jgi:hypothetical protein
MLQCGYLVVYFGFGVVELLDFGCEIVDVGIWIVSCGIQLKFVDIVVCGGAEGSGGDYIVIVLLIHGMIMNTSSPFQLQRQSMNLLLLSRHHLIFRLGQLLDLVEYFEECGVGGIHVEEVGAEMLEGRFDGGG